MAGEEVEIVKMDATRDVPPQFNVHVGSPLTSLAAKGYQDTQDLRRWSGG